MNTDNYEAYEKKIQRRKTLLKKIRDDLTDVLSTIFTFIARLAGAFLLVEGLNTPLYASNSLFVSLAILAGVVFLLMEVKFDRK